MGKLRAAVSLRGHSHSWEEALEPGTWGPRSHLLLQNSASGHDAEEKLEALVCALLLAWRLRPT